MTDSRNDIIRAFVLLLAMECPTTTAVQLLQIERDLRKEWGGKRTYVCKDAATDLRPKARRDIL
jgi:hypothetical protein